MLPHGDMEDNLKTAPLMGYPGAKLTGVTLAECLTDAQKQFAAIAALYEMFRPDYVFPMMDLTVECEAAGAPVRLDKDESPAIEGALVRERRDLERLAVPEPGANNRLSVFVETLALMGKHLPGAAVKCGYIMGPFSMAGRLMGTEQIALNIVLEAEFVHDLLRYCLALLEKYAASLLATGLDALWILEPTASLISPPQAEEFSNRYIRPLAARAKAAGAAVVLHNCGRIDHLLPGYAALGLDGLSIGSAQDISRTREALPAEVTLFGNLDPSRVFLGGSRTDVRRAAEELLTVMRGRPNFVPASGCDLPPSTPLANIEEFMAAMRGLPNQERS